jgi:hypothetical protein
MIFCSVAEPEPGAGGAIIKLPTGAGVLIMNYISGSARLDFDIKIVLCRVI